MPFLRVVIQWAISPEACGYYASALVLATFCMRRMLPLRLMAIASNIAFFTYGVALGLVPVALLHATLFPINIWRLRQCMAGPEGTGRPAKCGPQLGYLALIFAVSGVLLTAACSPLSGDIECSPEHWSATCRQFARAVLYPPAMISATTVRARHGIGARRSSKYRRATGWHRRYAFVPRRRPRERAKRSAHRRGRLLRRVRIRHVRPRRSRAPHEFRAVRRVVSSS